MQLATGQLAPAKGYLAKQVWLLNHMDMFSNIAHYIAIGFDIIGLFYLNNESFSTQQMKCWLKWPLTHLYWFGGIK